MTMNLDQDSWLTNSVPCIEEVQKIMSEKMSDNPVRLYDQLITAEVWMARMSTLLAESNARLDAAEYSAMMRQSEEMTVKKMEITVAKEVSNDRRMRDIIEGLCKSISNRLILGMSLMRATTRDKQELH